LRERRLRILGVDDRELSNILVSRGAMPDCPICGVNHWTTMAQRDLDFAIPAEQPDGRKVVGLRVVPVACLKCGFVRLHAWDILSNEAYLSDALEPPEDA
jgi:hypothetical protein